MIFFVRNQKDADVVLEKLKDTPRFAFDTETDGLNITTLNCAGFSVVTEDFGAYFPLRHSDSVCCPPEIAWSTLQTLVSQAAEVCFHNAAFDINVARKCGNVVFNDYQIRDSLVAAKMLNLVITAEDNRTGDSDMFDDELDAEEDDEGVVRTFKQVTSNQLKPLVEAIFNHHAPTLEEITGNVHATLLLSVLVGPYCISDAYWTLRLCGLLESKLRLHGMYRAWIQTECPFLQVIAEMTYNGFKIDTNMLHDIKNEFIPEVDALAKELYSVIGDPRVKLSTATPVEMLFDRKIWDVSTAPPRKKKFKDGKEVIPKASKYSAVATDKTCLKYFAVHGTDEGKQIAKNLLKWRELSKIISTYTDGIIEKVATYEDGRLRCNIDAARTYRLTSNGPNMQNIPSRGGGKIIRKAFIVEPGKKQINIDFSQVELRVAGHLAKDKNLVSVYAYGKDLSGNDVSDLHEFMANAITKARNDGVTRTPKEARNEAKTVNFGFLNQQGAENFAVMYDFTIELATLFRDTFFKSYKQLEHYYKECEKLGMETGYVTLLNGARRFFVGKKSERIQMSNTPIQGNAALCMKHAMINTLRCFREKGTLNTEIKIVMSVHDEGIYECDEDKVETYLPIIKSCFELVTYTFGLTVPLLTDIKYADTWADSH